MKNLFVLCGLVLTLFFIPNDAFAHPGRTAADGCHYCRTNCDYWGVPWNERHCHGGGVSLPAPTVSEPAGPFTDVSRSNGFVDAISYVKGYGDGTYKPDASITRAEFTKIIVEA